MKYLYTPTDIAIFFLTTDFTISDEKAIIDDIWRYYKSSIWYKYRKNKEHFRRSIYNEISKYDGTFDEIDELNLILQDLDTFVDINSSTHEEGVIESYFKLIKLHLTFVEGREYRKIKLRNLLGRFGYKRRTQQLTECIERTLKQLGLSSYLKGYVPCSIREIKLDDVIIIRLKDC